MIELPEEGHELPVTIITGFLGSGKTTLLNHILSNQQGVRTAVLVNEFGEIGIDQELIVSDTDGVLELNNGCICCTINNQLVETVAGMLERRDSLDYLIVETTGLADPMPVAMTFVGRDLSPHTRLDSIITLVDAENFNRNQFKNEVAHNQIRYSDIVLLNKTDLVDESRIDLVETRVKTIKTGVRIIRTHHARVPLSLILDTDLFAPEQIYPRPMLPSSTPASPADSHDHSLDNTSIEGFTSVSFNGRSPFDPEKLQYFFAEQLPAGAIRAKGILWFSGHDERHLFSLCGQRFTMERTDWGRRSRQNKLVIIGQCIDQEKIRDQLSRCLVFDDEAGD